MRASTGGHGQLRTHTAQASSDFSGFTAASCPQAAYAGNGQAQRPAGLDPALQFVAMVQKQADVPGLAEVSCPSQTRPKNDLLCTCLSPCVTASEADVCGARLESPAATSASSTSLRCIDPDRVQYMSVSPYSNYLQLLSEPELPGSTQLSPQVAAQLWNSTAVPYR